MSWLYLALELLIIGSMGFLTIYFRVMYLLGYDWARTPSLFSSSSPVRRHAKTEVPGTSNSRIPDVLMVQTLPHASQPLSAAYDDGLPRSSSPRGELLRAPLKVSGRPERTSWGSAGDRAYRNTPRRIP